MFHVNRRALHSLFSFITIISLVLGQFVPILPFLSLPIASAEASRSVAADADAIAGHGAPAPVALGAPSLPAAQASALPAAAPAADAIAGPALKSAPIMFIENVGQFGAGARFQVRGGSGTIYLGEDGLWLTALEQTKPASNGPNKFKLPSQRPQSKTNLVPLATPTETPRKGVNIRQSFVGSNPHPRLEPFDRLNTHVSYFVGNDSAKWQSDVPVWGGVRYKDLYPGIDLEITGEKGQLVERLVARSDSDLSSVRMRVEGADAISTDATRINLTTAVGKLSLPLIRPVGADGKALARPAGKPSLNGSEIASPFAAANLTSTGSAEAASGSNAWGLVYSTYLGGNNWDQIDGLAATGTGSVFVSGETYSTDFPTTPGAFGTPPNSSLTSLVFVAKLDTVSSALIYVAFVGGDDNVQSPSGLSLDSDGNAYVTGWTQSRHFPTTPGAFQETWSGLALIWIGYVFKLDPTGSHLVYSTLLGPSTGRLIGDLIYAIAIDGGGNAYVTGVGVDSAYPTTPGAYEPTWNGSPEAFVTKLNATGSALTYSTFLDGAGGSGSNPAAIVVDAKGSAYVTGFTDARDYPTTSGAFDRTWHPAYVSKLDPISSSLPSTETEHTVLIQGCWGTWSQLSRRRGSHSPPLTSPSTPSTLTGVCSPGRIRKDTRGRTLTAARVC